MSLIQYNAKYATHDAMLPILEIKTTPTCLMKVNGSQTMRVDAHKQVIANPVKSYRQKNKKTAYLGVYQ